MESASPSQTTRSTTPTIQHEAFCLRKLNTKTIYIDYVILYTRKHYRGTAHGNTDTNGQYTPPYHGLVGLVCAHHLGLFFPTSSAQTHLIRLCTPSGTFYSLQLSTDLFNWYLLTTCDFFFYPEAQHGLISLIWPRSL